MPLAEFGANISNHHAHKHLYTYDGFNLKVNGTGGAHVDCFSLTAFDGQHVTVEVDLDSDSSVQYPGEYISAIEVGAEAPSPTEGSTWGEIKSLFRWADWSISKQESNYQNTRNSGVPKAPPSSLVRKSLRDSRPTESAIDNSSSSQRHNLQWIVMELQFILAPLKE